MTDLSGRTLKGYQIGDCIDQGGFGAIYRARETAVNREVAIKVILPQYASKPDFIRGFETEAQLLARLQHPHITPLYTYWRDPDGAYLVMQYLHEGSLIHLIEKGPLPLETIARLLDQITDALAFAHKHNVVHRDLKPGNILIDSDNNAYLTDFGIAVGIGRGATSDSVTGSIMYMSPEQLDNQPASPTNDIYSLGIVLYEMLTGMYPYGDNQSITELIHKHLHENVPDLPDHLPHGLSTIVQKATHKDRKLRFTDPRQIAALFNKTIAGEITPAPDTVILQAVRVTNPYKGLRAFQQADAPDFYGRQALVDRLLERLVESGDASRFLAVVGPSGSGKSSVARAGLIPELKKGGITGSDTWFITDMIPGPRPLDELEVALTRIAAKPGVDIMAQLQRDEHGLHRVVGMLLPDDGELFLMIDQFEEVYTVVKEDDRRKHFLALIGNAVTHPRSRVRVAITLRADFYDRPLMSPELSELVRQRTEVVVPLTPEELEQAIGRPAEHVGMKVESALVAAMVAEVSERPGTLPLLQYSLTELFDRRDNNTLSLETYNKIGGVMGALTRRADELFSGLDDTQQEIMRQIFMRLMTLGEGTEDLRRRVLFSEIAAISADAETSRKLLDRFANYRLLTMDHDPITQEATVEVAHEALIREWRTLRDWLDQSRDDIRMQRMLATATRDWHSANRETSYLLTGARLTQFNAWVQTTAVALTDDERHFLNTSITTEQKRLARIRLIRNMAVAAISLLAMLFAVLALFAFDREAQAQNARATSEANLIIAQQERDNAQRQADINRSLVLANEAQAMVGNANSELGLLLALEAVNMTDPPAAAIRSLESVGLGFGTNAILRDSVSGDSIYFVNSIDISPDSTLAVSGGCANVVGTNCLESEMILWDIETRTERLRFASSPTWLNSVVFSNNGDAVFAAYGDGTIIQWDIISGGSQLKLDGHNGSVNHIVLSPDGRTMASAGDDGLVILWNTTSGEIIRRFEGHKASVNRVAFNAVGDVIASGSKDTDVILWNSETGEQIGKLADHKASVTAIGFNKGILYSIAETDLREWNLESNSTQRSLNLPCAARDLAFTVDLRRIVLDMCQTTMLYDLEDLVAGDFRIDGPSVVMSLAASADGRFIMSGFEDGALIIYNTPETAEIRSYEPDVPLMTASISPDGKHLLTGAFSGGVAILWDTESGQEIHRFSGLADTIGVTGFNHSGTQAIIGSADFFGATTDKKLILVDMVTYEETQLVGHNYGTRVHLFSSDDSLLLTGSVMFGSAYPEHGKQDLGELLLWDTKTGELIRRFDNTKGVYTIWLTPDEHSVYTASGMDRGMVEIWDMTTGQLLRQWDVDAAVSLFSGVEENTLLVNTNLIHLETGEIIRRFTGYQGGILGIDISPDHRYLITGDTEGDVILWDYETGEEIRRFGGYTTTVWSTVFHPDGQSVFSAAYGDVVHEWRISDWTLAELLEWIYENRYIREFTCSERKEYNIEPLCSGEE